MAEEFLCDAPVAYASGTGAAAYDGAGGADVGSTATATNIIYKRCSGPCTLKLRFMSFVPTAPILGATDVVLTAAVRPTVGVGTVASGTRVIGTITVKAGAGTTILGDVLLAVSSDKDINVNPGEEVIVELTTKGASTGTGFVTAAWSQSLLGPTAGGTPSTPILTAKPYGKSATQGAAVGQVKCISTVVTMQ